MKRGLYERSEAWGSFHSFSPLDRLQQSVPLYKEGGFFVVGMMDRDGFGLVFWVRIFYNRNK